jgi:hypothetical protein
MDVVRTATRTGAAPNVSDALTVNGQPGDLCSCSSKDTTTFVRGEIGGDDENLLRFINAAVNEHGRSCSCPWLAGHTMTVVAADASYTKPYSTSVLFIAPGQTTDVCWSPSTSRRGDTSSPRAPTPVHRASPSTTPQPPQSSSTKEPPHHPVQS